MISRYEEENESGQHVVIVIAKWFSLNVQQYYQELRAFSSLVFSKNKPLAAIDWHPKRKGMVAVAPIRHLTFNQRVDVDGMVSEMNAKLQSKAYFRFTRLMVFPS